MHCSVASPEWTEEERRTVKKSSTFEMKEISDANSQILPSEKVDLT